MAKVAARRTSVIEAWLRIPDEIERTLRGLSDKQLDIRYGEDKISLRETVHHIAESNLVASNIILAALACQDEPTYDWSWVWPNAAWMRRLSYDRLPIDTALTLLRGLGTHVAALIAAKPNGLQRTVKLLDAPDSKPYTKTVAKVLEDEVDHARKHLEDAVTAKAK